MAEPGPALCSGCLSGLLFAHHPLMCLCVFWLCLALFVTDLECFRLAGGCAGQCADDSPQQHKRHQAVTQSVCFGRCRSARGVGWVHTPVAACGLRPSVQPGADARVLKPALVVLVQPHHLRVCCVFVCALQRVNLLNATKTMWPAVPSVVTNVLKSLTFDTLRSSMPAGAWGVVGVCQHCLCFC